MERYKSVTFKTLFITSLFLLCILQCFGQDISISENTVKTDSIKNQKETGDLDTQIKTIILQSETLQDKGKHNEAITLLTSNIELSKKNQDDKFTALLHKNLGEVYKDRAYITGKTSDLTDAKLNFNDALKLGTPHLSIDELVEISLDLASTKYYTCNNEESAEILLNIINNYEDNPYLGSSLLGKTYVNMAMEYRKLGQEEKAILFLEKTIKTNKNPINIYLAYRIIGEIHEKNGTLKEARDLYKKALNLIDNTDKSKVYNLLERIGNVCIQLKDYNASIQYYKRAIENSKNYPASYTTISVPSYYGLGLSYFCNGQLSQSRRRIQEVIEFLSAEGNTLKHDKYREVLCDAYLLISQIDEKQQRYKNSLLNYKKHTNQLAVIERRNDSLFNLEKLKTIEELELTFETDKKDMEISTLKANNDLQELESKQQRNFGIGLVIGTMLVLVLLFIVLKALSLKQSIHKTIKEKYKENQLLMGEIHHRVKNNLQIIISLLNAQINSAQNDKRLQIALKESQTKIKSMAIIHQSLYNSSTYTKVKVNNYFKELLEQVQQTFQTDGKIIQFETDIEHKEINMSLAVPLGLIINELITNSYKYAFNQISTKENKVSVLFKSTNEPSTYKLEFLDNGIGLPDDFDIEKLSSFGMQLVKGLVDQLHGTITITEIGGTGFEIYIQEPQAA